MINATKKNLVQLLLLVLPITSAIAGDSASSANTFIIDVRTEAEWNAGHLEGGILIPHDRIETGITQVVVDKKATIYLYCRSGRRTALAVGVLKKSGYQNVTNLETMENASKVLGKLIVK
jgi:phage shock protein E